MRRIVVSEFVTLDGVMEAPEKWSFPFWNEDLGKFKFDELFASDALLMGRETYEIFAKAWPNLTDEKNWERIKAAGGEVGDIPKENPFADRMNSIAKFVVSTSLEEAGWNNSRVVKGDVVAEVSRLKQQPGKAILIYGSGALVDSLTQHDLVDEYRLLVYPVVLGSGKRLFRDTSDKSLKLLETKPFSSGVVLLRYRPEKK